MMSMHGGKARPTWECREACNVMRSRYATEATETALQSYKNIMGYDSAKEKIKAHIEQMEKQSIDMSELADNLLDKINDEKKKLEVLKDVFSMEQLKKEIGEIKMLEKEYEKQNKILQNLIEDTFKERQNLNNDELNESIIDKIIVHKIDRFIKILDYHIHNHVYSIKVDYRHFIKPIYTPIE